MVGNKTVTYRRETGLVDHSLVIPWIVFTLFFFCLYGFHFPEMSTYVKGLNDINDVLCDFTCFFRNPDLKNAQKCPN